MKSTSRTGGRCEEQGNVGGAVGQTGTEVEGAKKSGVSPWVAGMYEKIKAFEIDRPGDAFPFSSRLARENGWSRAYALRVIEEYKRFVCLMATAAHPVTPSDDVDQAWHLHMTYTRSYWDGMCQQIVGRPLHHDPTRGGSDESAKFTGWYARTLETYRRVFKIEPPADIWPSPAARFEPTRMQWVDLAKFRLVRRKRRRNWLWLGLVPAIGASAGCAGVGNGQAAVIGVVVAIPLLIAIVLIAKAAGGSTQHERGRRRRGDDSTGCSSTGLFPFWFSDSSSNSTGHGHGGDGHSGHGHGDSGGSDGVGHGCSGASDGGGGGGCSSGGGCGGGGD